VGEALLFLDVVYWGHRKMGKARFGMIIGSIISSRSSWQKGRFFTGVAFDTSILGLGDKAPRMGEI
jgi:hypothetical protein